MELEKLQMLNASPAGPLAPGLATGGTSSPWQILGLLPHGSGPGLDTLIGSAMAGGVRSFMHPHATPPSQTAIDSAVSSSGRALIPKSQNFKGPNVRPFVGPLTLVEMAASGTSPAPQPATAVPTTGRSAIRPMRISSAVAGSSAAPASGSGTAGYGLGFMAMDASGSGSGSGPGWDSLRPYSFSKSLDDGAGDSISVNVSYNPNSDGTFTFSFTLTETYGTQPGPGGAADDSSNTNSGTSTVKLNISVGNSSATITASGDQSDTYNYDENLTGSSSSGTWTDYGHDHAKSTETATLNFGGVSTFTYSDEITTSDKYKLNLSGSLADGGSFTYTDSGNDSTSAS